MSAETAFMLFFIAFIGLFKFLAMLPLTPRINYEDWDDDTDECSGPSTPSLFQAFGNQWALDRTEDGIHLTAATVMRESVDGGHHGGASTIIRSIAIEIDVRVGRPLPFFTFEAVCGGVESLVDPSPELSELSLPPGFAIATDDPQAVATLLRHPAVVEPFGELLSACRNHDHVLIGARGSSLTSREIAPVPSETTAEPLLKALSKLGAALRHAIDHPQPGPATRATPVTALADAETQPADAAHDADTADTAFAHANAPATRAPASPEHAPEPTAYAPEPTSLQARTPPPLDPDTPPPLPDELS